MFLAEAQIQLVPDGTLLLHVLMVAVMVFILNRTLLKPINEILAEPAMKARLAELGGVPIIATPEEFGKVIQAETDKWEKVVKFAGARVE